jgi:hypothetical protein
MKAFVQTKKGEFVNPNDYNAWRGFQKLGYETIHLDASAIFLPKALTKETPVFAGVQGFKKVMKHLKVEKQELPSYPDCLKKFLGREIRTVTLGELRVDINKYGPVFIKPNDEFRKHFNGHVVKESMDLRYTLYLPDDYEVLASDIVNFDTEYRVFIHKGAILDSRNYKGFRGAINYDIVEEAIKEFENAPVAYCLDFGLTKEGKTLLVEVTDANSCGCYGLDCLYYGRMLADRWEELMK